MKKWSHSQMARTIAKRQFEYYYRANECGDPESWLLNPIYRYWDENSHLEFFRKYPDRLIRQRAAKKFGKMVRQYRKS